MLSIFMSINANKVIQISDKNIREYQLNPRIYFHSYSDNFNEMSHKEIRIYVKMLYTDAIEIDDSFITL